MTDSRFPWTLFWSGIIVALIFVPAMISSWDRTTQSSSSLREPESRYSTAQLDGARRVMDLVRSGMATMKVEGPHLVVNFTSEGYPVDETSRLGLIRSIADADAVRRDGALRNIYFYDPSGRLMGQADALNGIRLKH